MKALLDAAKCSVVLARGELDPFVTDAQLDALVPEHVTMPGLGHNAHVEDAVPVLALL
ncbi:MAG TPA: hypothetical protein VLI04_17975 [Nocardioidaceae bacterium]|nr:hypothetical protein [Nocardioidaceae bacterium]